MSQSMVEEPHDCMAEPLDGWSVQTRAEARLRNALRRKFGSEGTWWEVYEWCVEMNPPPLATWERRSWVTEFQREEARQTWGVLAANLARITDLPGVGYLGWLTLIQQMSDRGCPVE